MKTALTAAGVLLAFATACASRPASEPRAPVVVLADEREARLSAAIGRHVRVDDAPIVEDVAAPAGRVHAALVAAYVKLGIPAAIADSASGVVAVTELRVDGRIAGERASRYVSCGVTVMGPRADLDRVVLTIVSRLKVEQPSVTRVATSVVGTATDARGVGSRQPCTTTGQLEARLHAEARATVGS